MGLLGSMMLDNQAVEQVLPILNLSEADRFYRHDHRLIFELILEVYDKDKPMDFIVVKNELEKRGTLERVGGMAYMVQLVESVPSWVNAEYYARIVRDKGLLRDLISCSGKILEEAYAGRDEAKMILDRAEQQLFHVTEQRISKEATPIDEILENVFAQIKKPGEGMITGHPSGFDELDGKTAGFQRAEMIVLAARPSMGKTAIALNMAEHMAVDNKLTVAFFSMEMIGQQIVQRLIGSRGRIDLQKLRKRGLNEEEIQQAALVCGELQGCKLYIDDTPGMTPLELRAKARRLMARHNLDVVFVDYLQLMYDPGVENRQQEVANMSRAIKAMARELNIPVIVLSQLNRSPEGREGHKPRMSDLRESGAIEQDADVVLLLHREGYYRPEVPDLQNTAELNIAKQRNGPVGTVNLHFNRQFARFGNLSMAPEPAPY